MLHYQYPNITTPKSYGDQEKFGVTFVIGQGVPERPKPLRVKGLGHVIPRGYDTPNRPFLLGWCLVHKAASARMVQLFGRTKRSATSLILDLIFSNQDSDLDRRTDRA